MTIALIVVLGLFIIFAIATGCMCSDASWAVQKYIQGDEISDDDSSDKERIYRTKLAADLMMGMSIMFGVASGFATLWVLLSRF